MSDPTITNYDETFGIDGKVIASKTVMRTARPMPTDDDLKALRAQLRRIATDTLASGVKVPVWGQQLSKAILAYTWIEEQRDNPPVDIEVVP